MAQNRIRFHAAFQDKRVLKNGSQTTMRVQHSAGMIGLRKATVWLSLSQLAALTNCRDRGQVGCALAAML
ncbi:MAG TPA: hypothetical protein PKA76_05010, partial [Pirellulaceae bacterium]|nr:hypothetical protein [Pirellulaceae bacterium]